MDQYHFYDEIGRGRNSQVYKGRQKKTVEYVAIKRVDKGMMERVVNEVQVMHRLNSPHTLRFHNWYETRNNLWLILEYCTGGDMLSLLKQDGRLPEAAVKMFGVDLMAGLQHLHASGYLFCDLKPSNVLVDEYGVVKLSDFGLSRRVPSQTAPQSPSSSSPGKAAKNKGQGGDGGPRKRGTPYYMAPELFLEEGVHSYKSELWSLGCVLFELAVGHPPWTSTSLNELIRQILYEEPHIPTDLPISPSFRALLRRLLHKDPLGRCGWEEALDHEFWTVEGMPQTPLRPSHKPLPPEPAYEATLEAVRARLPTSNLEANTDDESEEKKEEGKEEGRGGGGQLKGAGDGGKSDGGGGGGGGGGFGKEEEGTVESSALEKRSSGVLDNEEESAVVGREKNEEQVSTQAKPRRATPTKVCRVSQNDIVRLSRTALKNMRKQTEQQQDPGQRGENEQQGAANDDVTLANADAELDFSEHDHEEAARSGTPTTTTETMASGAVSGDAKSHDDGDDGRAAAAAADKKYLGADGGESKRGHGEEKHGSSSSSSSSRHENTNYGVEKAFSQRSVGGAYGGEGGHSTVGGRGQGHGQGSSMASEGGFLTDSSTASQATLTLRSEEEDESAGLEGGDSPSSSSSSSANSETSVSSFNAESSSSFNADGASQSNADVAVMKGGGRDGLTDKGMLSVRSSAALVVPAPSEQAPGGCAQGDATKKKKSPAHATNTTTTADTTTAAASTSASSASPSALSSPSAHGQGVGAAAQHVMNAGHAGKVELERTNSKSVAESVDGGGEYWAWEEEVGMGLAAESLVTATVHDGGEQRWVAVSDLVLCGGDTSVKPIIFNRAIEVIDPPSYRDSQLPFQPKELNELSSVDSATLEAFLTVVYKALASRDLAVSGKVHVLSYLYRLSKLDSVANIVVNSSFAPLLLKMARRFKSCSLRALVVTLLGVLIRHATLIVPDVGDTQPPAQLPAAASPPPSSSPSSSSPSSHASSSSSSSSSSVARANAQPDGLIKVLVDLLKDPNAKLRRRAMATLGELLFYISTLDENDIHAPAANPAATADTPTSNQRRGDHGGTVSAEAEEPAPRWFVPAATMSAVARCLHCPTSQSGHSLSPPAAKAAAAAAAAAAAGGDEVVCHYAAKTVENVLAHAASAKQCKGFTSQEIALRLIHLTLHKNGCSEGIRTTAASALAHLLRRVLIGSKQPPEPPVPAASGPRLVAKLLSDNATVAEAFLSTVAVGVGEASSPRLQVAFLNVLVALFHESGDGWSEHQALLRGGVWAATATTSLDDDDFLTSSKSGNGGHDNGGSSGSGNGGEHSNSSSHDELRSKTSSSPLRSLRAQLLATHSPRLVGSLVRCVDRAGSVSARAKALLALRVLGARNPAALVLAMERGLLLKLDRLVSVPEELEQNPYLRQAALAFLVWVVAHAAHTVKIFAGELESLASSAGPGPGAGAAPGAGSASSSSSSPRHSRFRLASGAASFPLVAHLVASQTVNEVLCSAPRFLLDLTRILEATCDDDDGGDNEKSGQHDSSTQQATGRQPLQRQKQQAPQHLSRKAVLDSAFEAALGRASFKQAPPLLPPGSSEGGGGSGSGKEVAVISCRGDVQALALLSFQGIARYAETLLVGTPHDDQAEGHFSEQRRIVAARVVPAVCRLLTFTADGGSVDLDSRAGGALSLLRLLLPPLVLYETSRAKKKKTKKLNQANNGPAGRSRQPLSGTGGQGAGGDMAVTTSVARDVLPLLPRLVSSKKASGVDSANSLAPPFSLALLVDLSDAWQTLPASELDQSTAGQGGVQHDQQGSTHLFATSSFSAAMLQPAAPRAAARIGGSGGKAAAVVSAGSLLEELLSHAAASPSPHALATAKQIAGRVRNPT